MTRVYNSTRSEDEKPLLAGQSTDQRHNASGAGQYPLLI